MKKLLCLMCVLVMLFAVGCNNNGIENEEPKSLTYRELRNEEGELYGFEVADLGNITASEITIPSTIYGQPVLKIAYGAFNGKGNITKIVIPSSVVEIEEGAFFGCSELTDLLIPSSVRKIGDLAFSYCPKLKFNEYEGCKYLGDTENPYHILVSVNDKTASNVSLHNSTGIIYYSSLSGSSVSAISLPSTVKFIADTAFTSCIELQTITVAQDNSVFKAEQNCILQKDDNSLVLATSGAEIPSSVKTIKSGAFSCCGGEYFVTKTIPNTVETIESGAFSGSKFKSVNIPAKAVNLDANLFLGCSTIEEITVDSQNEKFYSVGNMIVDIEEKRVLAGCKTSVIPDDNTIKTIGEYAFNSCSGLTTMIIPEGVRRIETSAFANCWALSELKLPSTLTYIGDDAFYFCRSLTTVRIPQSVANSLSEETFSSCFNLESVEIPSSITKITVSVFKNCSKLNKIYFMGSKEEFDALDVKSGNENFKEATVYFYSETEPQEEGNFYHYVEGEIVIWENTQN